MTMELEFEWHPRKAADNVRNHKVTFTEAATVFGDDLSATVYDRIIPPSKAAISPWAYPIVAVCWWSATPSGAPGFTLSVRES
jgi:hypothetical protein